MSVPYYQDDLVMLLHGDALTEARTLGTGSVQSIVTSPPYFGLRDYGETGQMGAEASVAEYVAGMVALFHELRRVLANDGTLWLNLGDSYSGATTGAPPTNTRNKGGHIARPASGAPKNLLGVPWRVAFGLQDDGWILRSDIIWAKPNPMPESVTDRPTKAHEYLFLFAKAPKYFYNAEAIAEDAKDWSRGGPGTGILSTEHYGAGNGGNAGLAKIAARYKDGSQQAKRNARTVWSVPTVGFSAAHFAVYPPELIRPCILAGSRRGDTILDPFSGSGTTGMVATQEGRKYVGIDLSSDYLDLSLKTRFAQPVLNFGEPTE